MKTQDNLQLAILHLLKISAEKYNELIFETGMSYLDNYLNGNTLLIRDFSLHKGFWSWWKMQFRIVDEAFMRKMRHTSLLSYELRSNYIHMHLTIDKHIDRVIWQMVEEKRDKMIHDLIKKEVNHE